MNPAFCMFTLGFNKNSVCSLTTFMKVWKDKYPNVVIPKNHRFTECKTCSHLKAILKGKPEAFGPEVTHQQKIKIYQEIVS